jgi:EF hand
LRFASPPDTGSENQRKSRCCIGKAPPALRNGAFSAINRLINLPISALCRPFPGQAGLRGCSLTRRTASQSAGAIPDMKTTKRRTTMNRIAMILGATLLAVPAFAQDAAAPVITDTDGNGTYSLEELQVTYVDLTAEGFAALDLNADGALDADELATAQAEGKLVLPQ